MELRSVQPFCSPRSAKDAARLSQRRSVRIQHDGKWSEVPASCMDDLDFRLDDLAISVDRNGFVVKIFGLQSAASSPPILAIYKIGNKLTCVREVPVHR